MSVLELYRNTCRTCAEHKGDDICTPLFVGPSSCRHSRKDVLAEMVAFDLKIKQDDGLPQQICSKCLENFRFVIKFRGDCKNAQDILEALYVRDEHSSGELKVDEKYIVEAVKSEDPTIKTETIETTAANSTKIEEVNIDVAGYEGEENWECTYLLEEKPEIAKTNSDAVVVDEEVDGLVDEEVDGLVDEEVDGLVDEDDDVESVNLQGNSFDDANNSDAESDDIPLKDYMGTKNASSKKEKELRRKINHNESATSKRTTYPCKYCDKECKSAAALARHEKVCPNSTGIVCKICTMGFDSKELLDTHTAEKHPNGGDAICPNCSLTFESVEKRDIHVRKQACVQGKNCEICNKLFKTRSNLKSHIARHHRAGEFECSICHKKFTHLNKYRYHWSHAHVENMKYKCMYCEKPFASQFVMRVHERSHTGERPFLCNQCGAAFRYRTQFLDHMKTHESKRDVACDTCGLTFYTHRQLSNHKRKHLSKNHLCELCNEAFPYKLDLNAHKYNVHKIAEYNPKRQIDYPFKCSQCSKGFSVLTSLTKHIKIHTDTERKHVCPHCGNGYKRSDHLKLHIKRMHLKITEFKCEVCGREYLEKCALKAHMVVHDSARPFICSKCPASFKRQRSLKDHILKHEGVKEYACGICDMRFFNRTIVVLHTKRVHSDSQKQFMSELVRKELEDAITKGPENSETGEDIKDIINV